LKKKILFITTSNLSTNPRLLKEIKLALNNEIEPHFIGFNIGGWSSPMEKQINNELNIKTTYLSALRKPFLPWFISSIIQIIFRKIYPVLPKIQFINIFGSDKRSILLIDFLRKINKSYDLIVAHNLGALYPAYFYSKKMKIPFAFDIEDFHPGEKVTVGNENYEYQRRKFIMSKFIPFSSYVSYASPLIGQYSFSLLAKQPERNILINNSFFNNEFEFCNIKNQKVQIVWFSQNIDLYRGLEKIIPLLFPYKDKLHITLIGNLYENFKTKVIDNYTDVITHYPAMPQINLHKLLCSFDIGLALEQDSTDLNRQISLTNKIFAYTQAGLYIIATPTMAQSNYLKANSGFGAILSENDIENIKKIEDIILNIDTIRAEKLIRFEKAKKLSFDEDSKKLINIWNYLN